MSQSVIDAACSNCDHWEEGAAPLATATRNLVPRSGVGVCRRYPPMCMPGGLSPYAYWPETLGSHFCGEWMWLDRGDDGGDGEEVPAPADASPAGETVVAFPGRVAA